MSTYRPAYNRINQTTINTDNQNSSLGPGDLMLGGPFSEFGWV
jgi:hypothetical protein